MGLLQADLGSGFRALSFAEERPNYALKGTLRTSREFPGYDVGAGPLNAALGPRGWRVRLLVPYVVLVAAVMLAVFAARAVTGWVASRSRSAHRALVWLEPIASLVCAVAVFGSVMTAAVAYPQSPFGVYAQSPESVELSAIAAAVSAAIVHALRGSSARARP